MKGGFVRGESLEIPNLYILTTYIHAFMNITNQTICLLLLFLGLPRTLKPSKP